MANDTRGEANDGDGTGTTRRTVLGAAALTGTVASIGAFGVSARQQQEPPDELDDTYGFAALSPETEPPVEPDHQVALEIRPVEGREEPEFVFDPVGLAIEPGDVVRFDSALGAHSVTAYHPALERERRVPENVPPFSSPLLATDGAYWLYRFDEPGVYDAYCLPHEVFGMVMRLVVGEAEASPSPATVGTGTAAGEGTGTSRATTDGESGATINQQVESPNGTATGTPGTGRTTDAGTSPTPAQDGTATGTPADGNGFELPEFPPTEAAQRVFDDPALDVQRIVTAGSVAWNELSSETRGIQDEETPGEEPTQRQILTALSGGNVVPPVETDASGNGTFTVTSAGALDYALRISSIQDVTQAHIHDGRAGENGPILYTLVEYTENVDGSGSGEPRSATGDEVLTIEGTIDDIDPTVFDTPGDLYVNVHTVANPAGEVRGQLQAVDDSADGTPAEETSTGTDSGTGTATDQPVESPEP
ncbi:CHRD domain-containing protein [Halorarius halobius]|uniref:CHRD domain-containing protein n=1 Tax=Halorarius halobius TaxID=2962671 RepID=UPI0020CD5A50|nr:CHRD domain-containing protein [Halorarius halobius]